MAKMVRRYVRMTEHQAKLLDEISERRGETFNHAVARMLWDQIESETRQKVATLVPHGVAKERQNGADLAQQGSDERHGLVRDLILEWHQKVFGVECTWDAKEATALHLLLRANPNWTPQQLGRMVEARFMSEGVTSERPMVWLKDLGRYAAGPLDRYGKAYTGGEHEQRKLNYAEQRIADNIRAHNELFGHGAGVDIEAGHTAGDHVQRADAQGAVAAVRRTPR